MSFNMTDLICIAVLVAMFVWGYSRGAVSTLIGLIGLVVSLVLVRFLAPILTNAIFQIPMVDQFFTEKIGLWVASQIAALESALGSQPGYGVLLPALTATGMESALISNLTAYAVAFVKEVMGFCLFGILLIVCFLLFQKLKRDSKMLNRVPVLGKANRIAGAALGVITGFVILFVLVRLVYYFALITTNASLVALLDSGMIARGLLTLI
ncbi:MAG: CvpA family protein [Eubacteriaceae bacterium]|nr:CvpA family protein [Eubacteriaceae bacterium]